MSKKIEAPTLEEAYKKASLELNCSITDLEIEIIQNPSKGFLGFGKKNAIILASCKRKEEQIQKEEIIDNKEEVKKEEPIQKEEIIDNKEEVKKEKKKIEKKKVSFEKIEIKEEKKAKEVKKEKETKAQKPPKIPEIKDEFQEFYKEKESIEDIAHIIEEQINDLFKEVCFDIDKIVVKPYDKNTLLIEFSGPDSALLIGKEGYRYKALSYMLFNWINAKYNLQIRLEIAEFLKSQEEMVRNYLKPLIEKIKKEGRGQTKSLDGVLVQIALKELRAQFPDKYVAIRSNRQGEKYIIINEFINKRND